MPWCVHPPSAANLTGTEEQPEVASHVPAEWAPAFADLKRVAQCRQVDRWTAEVVSAFGARGIRPILLKGPAIARWLYSDAEARSYCDVDVLVSPSQLIDAEEVLREIGFDEPVHPKWLLPHARAWIRASDGARVDLHRILHAMQAISPESVWEETSTGAESCVVGGLRVDIPGPVMRTLHVVLHTRGGEDPQSQASEDLRRALAQVDRPTWSAAADMARRLSVADDMGQRLRQSPDGSVLADELGLPSVGSLRSYARSELPLSGYAFWCFGALPNYRAKIRWIVQRQFPTRSYMEQRYRLARSGVVGLGASYAVRLLTSCVGLPRATLNWVRFKHHLKERLGGRSPA
jgi:hypothetical protein